MKINIFKKMKEQLLLQKKKYVQDETQRKEGTQQKTALKLLAGFFSFMLIFTLLSRVADGMTISNAQAKTISKGTINHNIKATGEVKSDGQQSIRTIEGLLINEVFARQGASIKANDSVLSFDKASSETLLNKLKNELAALNLKKQKDPTQETAVEKAKRALDNANSDYERARNKSGDSIRLAQNAFDESVKEYDKAYFEYEFKGLIDKRWKDWSSEPTLEKYEITKVYPDSRDEEDQAANKLNVIEARKSMKAARQLCLDKKELLDSALKSDETDGLTFLRAIETAQMSYDEALEAETKALSQASVDSQGYSIDMKAKQADIDALQKLKQNDWTLKASDDGIILSVAATVGTQTTNGELASLSKKSAGYKVLVNVTKEQVAWLKEGDEVTVALMANGEQQTLKSQITSIALAPDTEKEKANGSYELTLSLPKGAYLAGETATMTFSKQSKDYYSCLPISALRSDSSDSNYVLVAVERDTVLGKEAVAKRVEIKIEDRDTENMAVTGSLLPNDLVISSSDKAIEAGDKIRLEK